MARTASKLKSTAVMQRRRHSAPGELDFFPTPAWATRAILEALGGRGRFHSSVCWEPACGGGHMAEPLREAFGGVVASDVHD